MNIRSESKISLSDELDHLIQKAKKEDLTISKMIQEFGVRGHALLIFIMSTPFILPIPTFGLSAVFGSVIGFISIFVLFGRNPWLPANMANKKLPKDQIVLFLQSSRRFLLKFEHYIKPRMLFLNKIFPLRAAAAIMIFNAAFLLALPLPPGTNTPPALCISLLSLGLIEDDNLFFILGSVVFIMNIILFGALFFTGAKSLEFVYNYFQGVF